MELGRLAVPEHVVSRRFGDQTVILNLETGRYHGVNATGSRVLEVIGETHCPEEAVRRVAAEFGAPEDLVRADVQRLCAELLERGLVTADDA